MRPCEYQDKRNPHGQLSLIGKATRHCGVGVIFGNTLTRASLVIGIQPPPTRKQRAIPPSSCFGAVHCWMASFFVQKKNKEWDIF